MSEIDTRRIDPTNDGLSYWSSSQFVNKNSGLKKIVGTGIQIHKGLYSGNFPPINAFKVDNKYTIMVSTPGLSEHEFSVSVVNGPVNPRIRVATVRNKTNTVGQPLLIHEIQSGVDFEFQIEAINNEAETILSEDVTATHKDGILAITFYTLNKDPRQPGESVKDVQINAKTDVPMERATREAKTRSC